MNINAKTEIYGIIGWPVEHSLSPAMHNAAFEHFGMNARYVPMPVEADALGGAAAGIRALNIKGVNLTVPHKVRIIEYLDAIEGVAAELEAVNVVDNRGGKLTGRNTDAEGFRQSLMEAGVEAVGRLAAVVGAGGASRAVIRALQAAGAEKIYLFNRTHEKAVAIAEKASGKGIAPVLPVKYSDAGARDILRDCAIIINATSLGLSRNDPPPIDPEPIHSGQTLVDLIYRPAETAFLAAGAAKGAKTVNGYGMLVFQALEAFRIWTGSAPPASVMWDAGLKEQG
ncbi:MAG: shikimate dehydrogenase [bacterium]